jgi:pimeloyl-ACP methyl ester carboxylesterase
MPLTRTAIACLALTLGAFAQSTAPSFDDLAGRFNYNARSPLEFNEGGVEEQGKALVIDLTYLGESGSDHVPAYLVMPHGGGSYPAIIWGHWLKKGSPLANRDEFLQEAVALARSGVVSLLIDAPQVRPDFVPETDPMGSLRQSSEMTRRQVIDIRRGVDLLLTRRNVDRNRIAYVGHSWDAHVGAILAAVEKRISTFVLMASGYSDEESTFADKDPAVQRLIKQVGEDRLREYFREYDWDDPVHFLGHTDGKAIFLQFADQDGISSDQGKRYLDAFSAHDKKMQFYSAPHALNTAALLDRDRWLEQHLKFKHPDEQALRQIPQLK